MWIRSLLKVAMTAMLAVAVAGATPAWREATGAPEMSPQLLPGAVRELAPGKLLVAARGLPDPNFSETVILLADYNEKGAMGLVINRPTQVRVATAFPHLGLPQDYLPTLYAGGPVEPNGVLALHRSRRSRGDARGVVAGVHLLSARESLESLLAARTGADRLRVYVGYAGWGPGQLERETLHGSWHVFSAEAAVVFDRDPDTLWPRQIRRTDTRMVDNSRVSPLASPATAHLRPVVARQ
jgi:putative transcriptional regulator